MRILQRHKENGYMITQYTEDGVTVSHSSKILITEPGEIEPIEPQPTIEEEILFENKYQTMLLEMTTLGGM